MTPLEIGQAFPSGKLQDIDGNSIEFPTIFPHAQSTVVFFYRGRW